MSDPIDLAGTHAFVTGAGTGIGRGIALALARRGVNVALVGRRRGPLDVVACELAGLGCRSVAIAADVTSATARQQALAEARDVLGALDILVNNAGVLAGGALGQLDTESIERAVATNLTAAIDLTRLALPDLAARRGRVVLVGSTMSHVPMPYASVYAATKAGLRAFGEALRYDVREQGIQVLTVYPPGTHTALVAGMANAGVPRGYRLSDAEQVGEYIVRALVAGRSELLWGTAEMILVLLHRLFPSLTARLLSTQQARFAAHGAGGQASE